MSEVKEETAPALRSTRVPVGSAVYNSVVEFLYEEACMLDEIRLKDWAATLAEDLIYAAPVRQTRPFAQQAASVIRTMQHYHDDYRSIMGRIMRLTETKSAWAEDPPSRTRRLVSNVLVLAGENPGEFLVRSNLLITRSRFNFDDFDLISGARHDVLRQSGESFKLARREILLDQSVLGTPNLAIFL
ncbi:aromatic-ring-hydroxylating dioxygenase [Cupriavidus sp. SHE]|jgi:3-phenylpropionate/cinnamic acid dioxygenase small subunit|uniref:3-phenylpropionate/cinnamic acid dioxygenase subunit beta n=1 Tax=Cupriavidus metallidurans TaxID=119219 RepID=A0A482IU44_9BURK|nr:MULTISPECIES: 3-phenylpropionate/cinnamic acid dioxygenase subunit beta [Cupriavidus]KWR76290.1 aromatic-ring-hydroxylating dioxygenase [Cupriavidus sp. SHE]QBP11821.1 3-phenylpropionate/cinnamic acid dioxygenase subunit beta [Cupriavidus metallidurans]